MGIVIIRDTVHNNTVKEDEVTISVQKLLGEYDSLEHPDYKGGGLGWCGGLDASREEWLEARTEGTCVAVPCGVTSTLVSVPCMY